MCSDYPAGPTWAPKEQMLAVGRSGRRFSINMLSAISPRGELRFMLHSPRINPDGVVWAYVKREGSRKLVQTKDEEAARAGLATRDAEAAGIGQVVLLSA